MTIYRCFKSIWNIFKYNKYKRNNTFFCKISQSLLFLHLLYFRYALDPSGFDQTAKMSKKTFGFALIFEFHKIKIPSLKFANTTQNMIYSTFKKLSIANLHGMHVHHFQICFGLHMPLSKSGIPNFK